MLNQRIGRRSINLSQIGNIEINQAEIICKWFRGLSILILILSLIIYLIKSLFISLTNGIFTIKTEMQDYPSSDDTNNNYSFNYSYADKNNRKENILNDNDFILNEKKFGRYIQRFNLTQYQKYKNRRKKEQNHLYELFKFNETGEISPILIDYSSSLPHYPLFAKENDNCFIKGEIISRIDNIINLTCIDISGIIYKDFDFIIRLSLLDKISSEIKLDIIKEINIKNEYKRNDGKHNVIFYEKNDTKNNLRYCSKELLSISQNYINIPKNFKPVIGISWPDKNQYFCLRNIQLFYEK